MTTNNIEAQTLNLVIQMQLEDLELLMDARDQKGKGREGEGATDLLLALDIYRAELTESSQIISDQTMCRSIGRAVCSDADAIGAAMLEEEQAAEDRRVAAGLGQGKTSQVSKSPTVVNTKPTLDDNILEKLQALYVSHQDGEDLAEHGESSAWATSRPQKQGGERGLTRICLACGDDYKFFDVATCPSCPHEYCRTCLESLFKASLTDETLFPPRCCGQPIPLEVCRIFLPSTVIGQFLAKRVEFETPNRTYCHRPACSAFVPPPFITGEIATCVQCEAQTCTMCKKVAHHGGDCPDDEALQDLLRLATEAGWQRCYRCNRVVELRQGCHHISKSNA